LDDIFLDFAEETREHYLILTEASGDLLFILDKEGNILSLNRAALKFTGYSKDEIERKNILEIIPEEYHQIMKRNSQKRERGNFSPLSYELEFIKKSGKKGAVEIREFPAQRKRELLGIFLFGRELSEIKKTEKKLQRLNLVLQAIRKVNQLITREKERQRLIQKACEILTAKRGYRIVWIILVDENRLPLYFAEAGVGKEFKTLLEEIAEGRWNFCSKLALSSSQVVVVEETEASCRECPLREKIDCRKNMTICLRQGKKIYGILSALPPLEFPLNKEEQLLFKEIAGDLSFALHAIELDEKRRSIERAVKEERDYAQNIINTVREPLLVLDGELNVISASRSFYRVFKVKRMETEGRKIFELGKRQWDIPLLRTLLSEILPKNTSFENFEVTHEFPHIGKRVMLLNARRIRQRTPKKELILLAIEDITERKKTEEVIKDYQSKLRSLTLELTLSEEAVRKNVSSFLHDNVAQKLALMKLKLDEFNDAIKRGLPLVDQSQHFIEEGIKETRSLMLELSPPILHELGLVKAMEWLTEQFNLNHPLRFEFKDDGKEKTINESLRLILFRSATELLMNAVKHSEAKKVRMKLRKTRKRVELSVRDDGKGFNPSKILPFSIKSGGFGLFSIRERLRELGGEMIINSKEGEGTEVRLLVPED